MTRPRSSIRIGTRNPNAAMLSAIWRICFFECVLALRALGLSASTESHFIMTVSPSSDAKAKRARCDGRRLQTKLSKELRLGSYPRRSHRASAGARCPSDCQPFWQLAVPGVAEVTSPAGITCRPDWHAPPQAIARAFHQRVPTLTCSEPNYCNSKLFLL